MKKFLMLAALIAISGFSPARAEAPPPCSGPDPTWAVCQQDSDCALGETVCGYPAAFNKASLEAVGKYNKCMGPTVSCPELKAFPATQPVVCRDKACQLRDK